MVFGLKPLTYAAAFALAAAVAATGASALDPARIKNADKMPADWLTYHGTYKSWHYSALDQINTSNVKDLQVAWTHAPGRSTRGLQSLPLAADGVLYYSSPYNQVFALDGATGEVIWTYKQKLERRPGRQADALALQPRHRARLRQHLMGTLDGKLVAIDMKTGKLTWETKLIDSEKLTVGFTGAPLFVKDKVIIGSQGGEWPYRGPIFGVDAKTGKKKWEFFTVGGNEERQRRRWGNDSWKTGGGGGWMAGGYDPETNTVWWGTGNPAPLYDWAGAEWKTEGPRPGDNLYTTSVIALDPDTGKLKSYHQELPHDAWDFDSAVGEFVMIERDGKKYVVHPNKGGFVFVYDRRRQGRERLAHAWRTSTSSRTSTPRPAN